MSLKGTSPEERKNLQVQAAQRALLQAEREQTQRFEIATLKYLREQGRRVSDAMGGTTKDERSVWDILMGAIPGYDPNSEDAAEQSAAAWSSLSEADRTRLVSAFTLGLIDWPSEETALLNMLSNSPKAQCFLRIFHDKIVKTPGKFWTSPLALLYKMFQNHPKKPPEFLEQEKF